MADTRSEPLADSALGWVTYYLALLFIVTPAIDFVANILPFQMGEVSWRYGTVGLLSGFLLTPILGLLIATLAATVQRQDRVLRVLGITYIIAGSLLLVATALFVLDVLEVRGSVPADAQSTFDIGSVKAFGKNVTAALGIGWLGIVNLKLARRGSSRGRRGSEERPVLFAKGG